MSKNLNPDEDQPVYVGGFWFVMKCVFLFLVSWLLMTQLAFLIGFRSQELWELTGFLFMLVSSFLTCIVLNVVVELVLRSVREGKIPKGPQEDELNDESR